MSKVNRLNKDRKKQLNEDNKFDYKMELANYKSLYKRKRSLFHGSKHIFSDRREWNKYIRDKYGKLDVATLEEYIIDIRNNVKFAEIKSYIIFYFFVPLIVSIISVGIFSKLFDQTLMNNISTFLAIFLCALIVLTYVTFKIVFDIFDYSKEVLFAENIQGIFQDLVKEKRNIAKRLFIIGNGFDVANNLPTKYEDFRQYISSTYNINKNDIESATVPGVQLGPKGEDVFSEKEAAEFLLYLISCTEGEEWKDIENTLGKLDYELAFDDLSLSDDENEWHQVYRNEDRSAELLKVVPYITVLFSDWINSIDIEKAVILQIFVNMIQKYDIFLTFNYTETLEHIYGIMPDKVCHIHGKSGSEIYFGHGNDEDNTEVYMDRFVGAENCLSELDKALRKDTGKAIKESAKFFNEIDSTIKEIFSYGFSYSDVDMVYIKELCNRLPDDATWYLDDHDISKFSERQKKIRDAGFKGEIRIWSL